MAFFSSRKVGGIRFTRIGRLNLSTSVTRKPAKPAKPARKRQSRALICNESAVFTIDLIGCILLAPLVAATVVHLMAG